LQWLGVLRKRYSNNCFHRKEKLILHLKQCNTNIDTPMLERHDNNNNKALDHHADEERDGESKADRLDISCGSSGHEDIGCLVGDGRQGEEQGKEDGCVAIEDSVNKGQGCHVYNDEESGCYAGDAGYDTDNGRTLLKMVRMAVATMPTMTKSAAVMQAMRATMWTTKMTLLKMVRTTVAAMPTMMRSAAIAQAVGAMMRMTNTTLVMCRTYNHLDILYTNVQNIQENNM
jgi:hypothetical protein